MNIKKTTSKLVTLLLPCISLGTHAANVSTDGGITVGDKNDPYWFKVGGVVKLDQRFFFGNTNDKDRNFRSGANLRDVGLDLDGGVGKDFTYTLGFSFNGKESKVSVEDAYVTYHGVKEQLFEISVGQVNPGFCLENTASSKWTPFLERSMASRAFGPCPGLGVSINRHTDNYAIIVSATQPKLVDGPKDANGNDISRNDRWQLTARGSYAWHFGENRIFQLGASGHVQDDSNAAARFTTAPEATARNVVNTLDTGRIASKNRRTFDFEISNLWGPLYTELEYQRALVHQARAANGSKLSNLHFNGYHAQVAYVLTGESRQFNSALGTFGKVVPKSPSGAWEIAARYSYINLNHAAGGIFGGYAHNVTGGVNYYANKNIRVSGEYTHSAQRAGSSNLERTHSNKRNLGTLGLRLQLVF